MGLRELIWFIYKYFLFWSFSICAILENGIFPILNLALIFFEKWADALVVLLAKRIVETFYLLGIKFQCHQGEIFDRQKLLSLILKVGFNFNSVWHLCNTTVSTLWQGFLSIRYFKFLPLQVYVGSELFEWPLLVLFHFVWFNFKFALFINFNTPVIKTKQTTKFNSQNLKWLVQKIITPV